MSHYIYLRLFRPTGFHPANENRWRGWNIESALDYILYHIIRHTNSYTVCTINKSCIGVCCALYSYGNQCDLFININQSSSPALGKSLSFRNGNYFILKDMDNIDRHVRRQVFVWYDRSTPTNPCVTQIYHVESILPLECIIGIHIHRHAD